MSLTRRADAQAALLAVLRAAIDDRAIAASQSWFSQLAGIRDPSIRARLLVDRLLRVDAHFALALLSELLDLASARDHQARELLLDLTSTRPLAEAVGYEQTRLLYALAVKRERRDVTHLFLSPEALKPRTVSEHFLANENQHLQDSSIGWRKKLARGKDRLRLNRLVFDRNPDVIRILLTNPRIIERDVVRIAAMRPANPDTLAVVFQSRKWLARYRVKVALACNPWSPIDIALACLPHLMTQDLRYAAGSAKLATQVRVTASNLLAAGA